MHYAKNDSTIAWEDSGSISKKAFPFELGSPLSNI